MTRRRDREAGFTLVEVMIAMVIALVALAIASQLLTSGAVNAQGQERDVQLLSIAQHELEAVNTITKQYGFDGVAMSGAPSAAAVPLGAAADNNSPSDPRAYVTGGSLKFQSDFNAIDAAPTYATVTTGATPTTAMPASETLIIGGSTAYPSPGYVVPYTAVVKSGNLSASVYRFVTNDTTGPCPPSTDCSGDARRVTIAVVPINRGTGTTGATTAPAPVAGRTRDEQRVKPVWLSTVLSSPNPKGSSAQAGGSVSLAVGLP